VIYQKTKYMSWIKEIPYDEAEGKLKSLYERVKGPNNNVDNVLSAHSLRPHTLKGHMELYKSVLHHHGNSFPKWYLETIGTYVSLLNNCPYCFDHHSEGLRKNLNDEEQFKLILSAIQSDTLSAVLDEKLLAGIRYSKLLTLDHSSITTNDIEKLRLAGLDDGEILEINQVACYFNYVNRMVVGLGINTEGDIIGLSPNNNEETENWSHS